MTGVRCGRAGVDIAHVICAFATGLFVCLAPLSWASAETWSSTVQEIRSDRGITAWLIEDHAHPVVALRFAFSGGSTLELEGKRGASEVLAELLNEGAGPFDAKVRERDLDRLATRINYSGGRDTFMGSVDSLSRNLDVTEAVIAAEINATLFQEAALERVVRRKITSIAAAMHDPAVVAEQAWYATVFGTHPYAAASSGTVSTLRSLSVSDIAEFRGRLLARDNLTIVASGDIGADRLRTFVDRIFGGLPERALLPPLDPPVYRGGERVVGTNGDTPETSVAFGFSAVPRRDPDFMAALVLNEILGSTAMPSRLGSELRERQGLVYEVETRLIADAYAAYVLGQFATTADQSARATAAVRDVIGRLASEGPNADEVENAKGYLIGAFPLSFDSNPKIADNLIAIAQAGLGSDYVETRQRAIAAVTPEAVSRMAARLLSSDRLAIAVARGHRARE